MAKVKRQRRRREHHRPSRVAAAPPPADAEARAARLGITPDRVLQEYRRIAFANLRRIVDWDGEGLEVKPAEHLSDEDTAAVAEIVAAATTGKPYRVKLHDKKAALDAIARYLGMLPPAKPAPYQDKPTQDEREDPRAILARKLAALAGADRAE